MGVREGSTRASPCPSSGDVEPSALPSKSLSPGTDGCVREEAEVPPSLLLWLLRTGRPPPEAPGRPGPSGPSSFLQAGLLPSLNRSDFLTEGPSLQRAKTLLFIPKQTESIPTPLHPTPPFLSPRPAYVVLELAEVHACFSGLFSGMWWHTL